MSPSLLLRLLGLSLALSLILEIVILFGIRHLNEKGEGPLHNHSLHIMARMVERSHDTADSLARFETMRRDLGLGPVDAWIISGDGTPLATFPPGRPLPPSWRPFPRPDGIHRVAAHYRFFHLFPDYLVLRLDRPRPLYLLVRESPSAAHKRVREWRVLFLFATMAASAFSGLFLTFLVFRQKSREARKVISALGRGELKARFPISRIDLIGSLMTDFNRMAQSIEELVGRIEENDRSRRDLLQELGHDLRTPLTSLTTAADTLVAHGASMTTMERDRFARIIRAESLYFLRMIEDLFFLAEMETPRYRTSCGEVNLQDLLKEEMESCKKGDTGEKNRAVAWRMEPSTETFRVSGSPVLLRRMFRNALSNARRHASSLIRVTMARSEGPSGPRILVQITDDGPGITPEAIAHFGERGSRRLATEGERSDPEISLGLGSVIIERVARLHGGQIKIRHLREAGESSQGTELTIELPA